MDRRRRRFLAVGAAACASIAGGCAAGPPARPRATVAVVGGGYGGATAAKYVRMLDPTIAVVLVEPEEAFVSCPLSNLVLGGFRTMADITTPYASLERRHGVRHVRDRATAIDMDRREVRLARGDRIAFERVIVAPGIDYMWELMPAMKDPAVRESLPIAFKAGPETMALRRRLEAMPDGGVFVIAIPETPYR